MNFFYFFIFREMIFLKSTSFSIHLDILPKGDLNPLSVQYVPYAPPSIRPLTLIIIIYFKTLNIGRDSVLFRKQLFGVNGDSSGNLQAKDVWFEGPTSNSHTEWIQLQWWIKKFCCAPSTDIFPPSIRPLTVYNNNNIL